jgi:hypothetical protein
MEKRSLKCPVCSRSFENKEKIKKQKKTNKIK